MTDKFDRCYAKTRGYEGGNVDDKRDPGGRTSRGVTQRTYNAWRSRKGLPLRDVFKATEPEVKEIYKVQYFEAVKGSDLPDGVDLIVFDTAINSGDDRAVRILQASLNALRRPGANTPLLIIDGGLGTNTLEAVELCDDYDALIGMYASKRLAFVRGLRTFKTFGKGWTIRINNVRDIAQSWASGSVGAHIAEPEQIVNRSATAKASDADISKPAVSVETVAQTTFTGGALSAAAEAAQKAADQIAPLADAFEYLKFAFVGLTVFAVGYGVYAAYVSNKAKRTYNADDTAEHEGA